MTVGWCGALIAILLLLHTPEPAFSKKKIIKLIVPHKIKFLHHTHVLLVTPSKKKSSSKIKEEIPDDEQNYHHYIHDGRSKGKPQVHYVLPYIAQSKEGLKTYKNFRPPHREHEDEIDSYIVDDYHSRRMPEESNVVVKVLPHKNPTVHRGLRMPFEDDSSLKVPNKPRYVYKEPLPKKVRKPHYSYEKPPTEEMPMILPSMTYHTLPENYDTEFMTPITGVDPNGLTPEEGGWGGETFSLPEKTPIRNYYKNGYFEPSAQFNL